jgi:type II secretory pathway pseudopilin PulG
VLSVSVLLLQRKALRLSRRRGITLIEAALVLSLTGVVVAAFVPTFLKQVHTSKLAEATQMLESMHRHAALYFMQEHATSTGPMRHCLPEAAGPFPLEPSVAPVLVDFQSDERGAATWRIVGPKEPAQLRYSYELGVTTAGCNSRPPQALLSLRAHGDLDGDGTQSLLERTSAIEHDELVPRGPLRILSRAE